MGIEKTALNEDVPPPPGDAEASPPWATDGLADKEEKYWDNEDDLRGQEDKNHLLWLKCYGKIVVVTSVIFTALFFISLIVWALHYILPEAWTWLSEAQLSKIQSIIFSGSMGAIISTVVKKQLSK